MFNSTIVNGKKTSTKLLFLGSNPVENKETFFYKSVLTKKYELLNFLINHYHALIHLRQDKPILHIITGEKMSWGKHIMADYVNVYKWLSILFE